jgi:hypothetical protein
LQFAKRLDPERMEKEKMTGTAGSAAASLDKKLRFEKIDLHSLGLKIFPDLPRAAEATPKIKRCCKVICRQHRDRIRETVSRLENLLWKQSRT